MKPILNEALTRQTTAERLEAEGVITQATGEGLKLPPEVLGQG